MSTQAVTPNVQDNTPAVDDSGELVLRGTATPVNESFDHMTVGETLLGCIDWDEAESRLGGEVVSPDTPGAYRTTRAHSFTIGDGKFNYQFSISVNRKPIVGGMGPNDFSLSRKAVNANTIALNTLKTIAQKRPLSAPEQRQFDALNALLA